MQPEPINIAAVVPAVIVAAPEDQLIQLTGVGFEGLSGIEVWTPSGERHFVNAVVTAEPALVRILVTFHDPGNYFVRAAVGDRRSNFARLVIATSQVRILQVDPSSIVTRPTDQLVRIIGSGFVVNTSLTLTVYSPNGNVVNLSGDRLGSGSEASLLVASLSFRDPGYYAIQVRNGDANSSNVALLRASAGSTNQSPTAAFSMSVPSQIVLAWIVDRQSIPGDANSNRQCEPHISRFSTSCCDSRFDDNSLGNHRT
jgi:hypothetical protein